MPHAVIDLEAVKARRPLPNSSCFLTFALPRIFPASKFTPLSLLLRDNTGSKIAKAPNAESTLPATMAEEIAQLKQLQAGLNAAFDSFFKAAQDSPGNAGALANAKGQIGTLAQITFGAVLGPAFSILGLTSQVSSPIEVGNLEFKAKSSLAVRICSGTRCGRSEYLQNCQ